MQLVASRTENHFFQRLNSVEPQVYKKLVIVGDSKCGKSQLLQRCTRDKFSTEYQPTVFETLMAEVDVGLSRVELALWDTPGLEKFDELRPLSYPDKDVVLVCFNIGDPDSLEHVKNKWIREVQHHCPKVPVMLVGLQKDLRKDKEVLSHLHTKGLKPVSKEVAEKVCDEIGALCYMECSARMGKGVDEVFNMAARMTLMKRKQIEKEGEDP